MTAIISCTECDDVCVAGYVASRHLDYGSQYIRCLVYVFSRKAHVDTVSDMLREVSSLPSCWFSLLSQPFVQMFRLICCRLLMSDTARETFLQNVAIGHVLCINFVHCIAFSTEPQTTQLQ